ncbi:MAG: amidohydrolase [Lachnospiraceae bacterium]|nr:amidohydrolase [Lachnospiraceae bacterium]
MLIIKNCNLISMSGIYKELYDVAVEGKLIRKVEKNLMPKEGDTVIDAGGKIVTPGFIEPHCHLGTADSGGHDGNEKTGPVHPELRIIDAIDFHSDLFDRALKTGVTTLAVGPGSSNIIGGTFAYVKSAGDTIAERVIKEEAAMKMALGENPKVNYSKRNQMPSTRMGAAALMRKALYQAKEYREKWLAHQEKLEKGEESTFSYDLAMHSLMRVFDGMLVKIHAHQANDIRTALRVGREFGLNLSIEHCTEGWKMIDELKEAGAHYIIGPTMGGKGKLEVEDKRYDSPAILEKAGVEFTLTTDSHVIPMEGYLPQVAMLIRHGLTEKTAYECVTIRAARAIDMADTIGTIEPGKDADLVIWASEPFKAGGKPETVLIGGTIRYQMA